MGSSAANEYPGVIVPTGDVNMIRPNVFAAVFELCLGAD